MLGHSSSGSFRPLCGRLTDISIVLGHHSATPAATACLRLAVAATPIGTAPKTVLIAFLPLLGYCLAASVALRPSSSQSLIYRQISGHLSVFVSVGHV